MYTDFEFAGKRLSDFGYIMCKFGGSSDLMDVEIGCDITFSTVKNNHSSIHYNTSSSYENVYTTSLEIMKNPCNKNQGEIYHINEEISMLTSWLNRREYHKFKPLTEEDNFYSVHYYGSFNVKEKVINDKVVGFVLSFTGNAPYGFGDHIVNEIDMNNNEITTSGDTIITTNAANWGVLGMKTFGKSWQNTVAGNQLFDFDTTMYTNGYKENVGVTATLTDDRNVIINGTSTASVWLTLGIAYLTAGETYTLFADSSLSISVWDSFVSAQLAGKAVGSAKLTFTPNNTGKHIIVIANPSGTTFNNVLANIMVVKGSTALDWEPYVGGIASPNPEYPQDIHSHGEGGSIEYTLTDGTEENVQSLILQTPNGLGGIPLGTTIPSEIANSPILMGGVYWDNATSQYYIGNTKDLLRGKNVQRIVESVIDENRAFFGFFPSAYLWQCTSTGLFNGHAILHPTTNIAGACIKTHIMSDRFLFQDYAYLPPEGDKRMYIEAGGTTMTIRADGMFDTMDKAGFQKFFSEHPTKIYAVLQEPIETDLTEEEIAQYKALLMNYPNNTIINDAGAYTEITYLQDYNKQFTICGNGDEYETIYPNMLITCKRDGDLKIKNVLTNTTLEVLNCTINETIYISGEHKFIDSDNKEHKNSTLFNDFNYEYLKLQVEDDDFSENVFEASLPCTITIGYYPIRKVGM